MKQNSLNSSSPSGRGSGEGLQIAMLDNLTCPACPPSLRLGVGRRAGILSYKERRNARKSGAGFTLIEVVVAVAVFTMTALMAVNLFVLFIQHQWRTLNQQELQNDARSVIEQIAKDVREGSIDYAYYATTFPAPTGQKKLFDSLSSQAYPNGNVLKNNCLVIRDAFNAQILYRLNDKVVERLVPVAPVNTACSLLTGWEPISPSNLTVSSFSFFISPSEDPFAGKSALRCDTDSSPGVPVDGNCRWGTICAVSGTSTCLNARTVSGVTTCYCFPQKFGNVAPLHPRVTFSLNLTRTNNQQTVSQVFQTAIASRIFKNIDRLNTYVP